jgi:hypothetical protein
MTQTQSRRTATQNLAEDLMAFAPSKSDRDTLHFKDAMKAEEAGGFKDAIIEEVKLHANNQHQEAWVLQCPGRS